MAVLQRLAQHLQRTALELGQLVQKKHPVVGERDLAGPGDRAAAEQADVRNGVVRRPHRPSAKDGRTAERLTRGGVDAEDLQRLLQGRGGEDARETFGHHGLARPWWPDHDQVVAPGGGDLDRTAERVLTLDLGKVTRARVGRGRGRERGRVRDRREGDFSGEEARGLVQRRGGDGGDTLHQRGFVRRGGREQHPALTELFGEARDGEGAADRSGRPGEAELAGDQIVGGAGRGQLVGGHQQPERDRQVVERALFAQMAGREVDGRARPRGFEAAVAERGENAVVRLLHGGVREADEDQLWFAALAGVDLHVDQLRFDPLEGGGGERGQHGSGGGGGGGPRGDSRQVAFNGLNPGIRAVGRRQVLMDTQKILVDFRPHHLDPKLGRAGGEVGRGLEGAPCRGHAGKIVGFGEFGVKQVELGGIVVGGHLRKVVRTGDRAGEKLVFGGVEALYGAGRARARAADGPEHGVNLVQAEAHGRKVGGRERATAEDVAVGVFCAGASAVGADLQVTAVVEERGGQAELEVARPERAGFPRVSAGKQVGITDRDLERVTVIVILDVVGLIVGVLPAKKTIGLGENLPHRLVWRIGKEAEIEPPRCLGNVGRAGGVGREGHAGRREWIGLLVTNGLHDGGASQILPTGSFVTFP